MSEKNIITANDVNKAIAKRHAEDMLFFEVKNGPTQTVRHHSRIDALAMKISWTRFCITGYEVKVSRSDFLRDNKWQSYLPMCNQLYFAVAPGVVDASEIPESCGLLQMTTNGTLRMVKKAPYREIEPPVDMFKYIMFNYTNCFRHQQMALPRWLRLDPMGGTVTKWQDYASGKAALKDLGLQVGASVRAELTQAQLMKERYEQEVENSREYKEALQEITKALGLTRGHWPYLSTLLAEIEQLRKGGGFTRADEVTVSNAAQQLNMLAERIRKGVESA